MKLSGKIWKKAAGITAAAAVAAGVILGGVFNSSDELLDKNDKALPAPPAVVEMVELRAEPEDDEDSSVPQEEKKKSLRERIRLAVLRIPYAVRAALCLPLWCVGQILIYSAGLLWSTLLSPVVKAILPWLSFALITAAAAATIIKLLNPELKMKDIFNKRNLIILVAGTVLTAIANIILTLTGTGTWAQMLAKAAGSTLVLAAIALPIAFKAGKNSTSIINTLPAGGV